MEEAMQLLVSCSICLDVVADQKQLPCQHNVCTDCLQQLVRQKTRISCPVCKKLFKIPNGGIEKMADCLLVKQIVELLGDNSPTSSDTTKAGGKGKLVELKSGGKDFAAESKSSKHTVKQKEEKVARKVKCLLGSIKINLAATNTQIAEKTAKLSKVQSTIDGAIFELKSSCEAKVLSLEHSKLIHREEIKSELDECSRRVQVYEQLQKDLESHKSPPTEGYSAEQKAKITELGNKVVTSQNQMPLAKSTSERFKEGDWVRILPSVANSKLSELMSAEVGFDSVGIFMKSMDRGRHYYDGDNHQNCNKAWVIFPEKINWVGDISQLTHTSAKSKLPFKDDKVEIGSNCGRADSMSESKQKRPAILMEVKSEGYSSIDSAYDVKAVVQYVNCTKKITVAYQDLKFFSLPQFKASDKVRVNSTIEEPSQGWGKINGSSVGLIKSIAAGKQTSDTEVVVEFDEEPNWSGVLNDLELWVSPSVGDQVQVKLSIREPYLKWGGMTHLSRGTLEKIVDDKQLGKVAEIKMAGSYDTFRCLLSEIEISRYSLPEEEPSSTTTTNVRTAFSGANVLNSLTLAAILGGGVRFASGYDSDSDY